MTKSKESFALAYCGEAVRVGDPDRFRDALFAKPQEREHLFALYAFNLELAKIAPIVSEPMLGEIRLQWWRDSLDMAEAGQPRRHEICEPLAIAVKQCRLPRTLLDAMIDARASDLDVEFPSDRADLHHYLYNTAGALTTLAAKAVCPRLSEDAQRVTREAGFGIGAARYLLAVPRFVAEGVSPLPGCGGDDLRHEITDLANAGLMAIRKARSAKKSVPREARPALLEVGFADRTLRGMLRASDLEDLRAPSAFQQQFGRLWRGVTGQF